MKLSVGRDKMHFLYYQIDQEGDGQPLCLGKKKEKVKPRYLNSSTSNLKSWDAAVVEYEHTACGSQ